MSVSAVSMSSFYTPSTTRAKSENEPSPDEALPRKDLQSIRSLNLGLQASPVPPDFMRKLLEPKFTRTLGDPDNAPSQLYAEIKVGNKTVAKVYNSGGSETPNSFAGRVQFGGPDEEGLTGPALAQLRAEKIAKACGGTIEKSDTATTQAEFEARPPRQFYVDYEGLNAEMERLRQSAEARRGSYRVASGDPAPRQSASITA
jgi:hypothetical protein